MGLQSISKTTERKANTDTVPFMMKISTVPDEGESSSNFDQLCTLVGVPDTSSPSHVAVRLLAKAGLDDLIPAKAAKADGEGSDSTVVGIKLGSAANPPSAVYARIKQVTGAQTVESGADAFRAVLGYVLSKQ